MSGRCGKCPPPTLPQTGWGMRADSEIASTIHPEDEIPLLGSFAQEKLSKERKKDGIETPIQMRQQNQLFKESLVVQHGAKVGLYLCIGEKRVYSCIIIIID